MSLKQGWIKNNVKNDSFIKYFCLNRSPIQCYTFPSPIYELSTVNVLVVNSRKKA